MKFAATLLKDFPEKVVDFVDKNTNMTHYWSDAMYEVTDGVPKTGMGIFLFRQGLPTVCARATVPDYILKQLLPRKQQIGQLEALACLLGPYCYPEYFRDADVMHYQDNTSSLAGTIRGGSGIEDSNCIFQLFAIRMATLRARYWSEFVESAANLADEPSRQEGACPIAEALGARIDSCQLPDLRDLWAAPLDQLVEFAAALKTDGQLARAVVRAATVP